MVVICDDLLEIKFVLDTNLIPKGKDVTSLLLALIDNIVVPSQQRLHYDYGRPQ